MVKIRIDSKDSISTVKKYFYPNNFDSISIKDDEQNFLYLKANTTYSLDFKNNTINKILKLSYNSLSSIINIKKDGNKNIIELNRNSPYYILDEGYKGKLILEVKQKNAFIEFLSNSGKFKIKEDLKIDNYEPDLDTVVIIIPKTPKFFTL